MKRATLLFLACMFCSSCALAPVANVLNRVYPSTSEPSTRSSQSQSPTLAKDIPTIQEPSDIASSESKMPDLEKESGINTQLDPNAPSKETTSSSTKPSPAFSKATCMFKGKKLWGRVKVVTSFPDVKVKVASSFPDLKVQKVQSFPDKCGKWQLVDSSPDFTIQWVDSFPDFTIRYVDLFPGTN